MIDFIKTKTSPIFINKKKKSNTKINFIIDLKFDV